MLLKSFCLALQISAYKINMSHIQSFKPIQEGSDKIGAITYWLALICVLVASSVTCYTIILHLKNYRRPDLQRSVLRITFMVPIYGLASIISLSSQFWSYYIDTLRDVYEAFVIYSFFTLLLSYLDGEKSLMLHLEGRLPVHHMWPFKHMWRPLDVTIK